MAVAAAGDGDLDHGEVGGVVVLVAPLLGGPPENVEGQVSVGLSSESLVHVRLGEPRFEEFDPCFELLLLWGSGLWLDMGWGWKRVRGRWGGGEEAERETRRKNGLEGGSEGAAEHGGCHGGATGGCGGDWESGIWVGLIVAFFLFGGAGNREKGGRSC